MWKSNTKHQGQNKTQQRFTLDNIIVYTFLFKWIDLNPRRRSYHECIVLVLEIPQEWLLKFLRTYRQKNVFAFWFVPRLGLQSDDMFSQGCMQQPNVVFTRLWSLRLKPCHLRASWVGLKHHIFWLGCVGNNMICHTNCPQEYCFMMMRLISQS